MLRVLNVPADLPQGIRYWIVGESVLTAHLRHILEKVRPESDCLGFADPARVPDDGSLILAEPDWRPVEKGLLGAGVNAKRIHILPVPESDPWAYWQLSKKIPDHIGAGGRVTLEGAEFWKACAFANRWDDGNWQSHYGAFIPATITEHLPRIESVMANLADRESRAILAMILSGEPPVLWQHYKENAFRHVQYLDCIAVAPGDVIVDGGIGGGFEIPFYLAHMDGRGAIHCFDPAGLDRLSDYVRATVRHAPGVVREHRKALADGDDTVPLSIWENGVATTAQDEAGNVRDVPCIRLDTFVQRHGLDRVDLISLDLEGGETRALPGIVETIRRFRPQLSISIYHDFNHYWDIPFFLMNVCRDYRFYIRLYSFERYEAILYAVPLT